MKTRAPRTLVLSLISLVLASCVGSSDGVSSDATSADTTVDAGEQQDHIIADVGHRDLPTSHDTLEPDDALIHPDASGMACPPDGGTTYPPETCPCGEVCQGSICVLAINADNKSCEQLASEWKALAEQARACDPQAVAQCTEAVPSPGFCGCPVAINVGQSALKSALQAIVTAIYDLGCHACYTGAQCSCPAPRSTCTSEGSCE